MLLKYYFDSWFFLEAEKGGTSSSKIHIFAENTAETLSKVTPSYVHGYH